MADQKALQLLIDESEIRNLIARLAHEADDGDLDDYMTLFTEDAVWGGAGLPFRRGHAEILEGARSRREEGFSGPGAHSRHVVTTTWIEIEGDQATGRSVYHFYVSVDSEPPVLGALGVYADRFRKTAQGWQLAERRMEAV